jgi:glycosyltransferase involved in cell wall biosynthesis
MTNRNKGQLRIGKSGTMNIGNTPPQESSIKVKIGRSGPISIGNNPTIKEKEEEERLRREKSISDKEEEKKRKLLEIIGKKKEHKEEDSRIEDHIIVKFANEIDEFNVIVQDNKVFGRSWHHGMKSTWWQGMSEDEARTKIKSNQDQEEVQKDEFEQFEQKIENSQKIEDVIIPDSQIRTVSDMIDQMTSQYSKDLPKDAEKRISYIYPLDSTHSFNIVAVNHIKHLRYKHTSENRYVEIEEIDWSQLSNIDWNEKRSILLHPFLYPFASVDSFIQNSKNFARLLAMKNKIGGFDVADSDRISKAAVDLINKIDLMMVPSNFVKDTYIKSGVTIPVEVLPHGISEKFSSSDIVNTDNEKIMKLRKMRQRGKILVLYFLVHSPHRKGADLVRRVMKRIQRKYRNVYLIVRSKKCDYFSEVKSVCIDSWLSDSDLVALYDSCDICLSPSRGGGFELNALEAVSRGIPTLVPNGGCFTDLMDYFIPVDLSDKAVQSLPGNTIHTGYGCQIAMDDFEDKLADIIDRLDYWKKRSNNVTKEIREKYSWRNTAKMLDEYLRNHGFIE